MGESVKARRIIKCWMQPRRKHTTRSSVLGQAMSTAPKAIESRPLNTSRPLVFDHFAQLNRRIEQLADLSVRAKGAEQAARKEQAHAAATKAVEKVNQEVKSANDTANRNWSAVKAKIADDMNHLKANIAHAKHEHDVKRAENRADRLEWEAEFAVDYAIASVEQAKLAVLDAVDGRLAAEEAKQA